MGLCTPPHPFSCVKTWLRTQRARFCFCFCSFWFGVFLMEARDKFQVYSIPLSLSLPTLVLVRFLLNTNRAFLCIDSGWFLPHKNPTDHLGPQVSGRNMEVVVCGQHRALETDGGGGSTLCWTLLMLVWTKIILVSEKSLARVWVLALNGQVLQMFHGVLVCDSHLVCDVDRGWLGCCKPSWELSVLDSLMTRYHKRPSVCSSALPALQLTLIWGREQRETCWH